MTASLHADALAVLSAWIAPTPGQELLRRRFVAHLAGRPDGLDRAAFPEHITASTLVLSDDGAHVLLTLHAKAKQWFQFGGHCEPSDRTLSGAAGREAQEESGLRGLVLDPVPVQLSAHEVGFCHAGGPVDHLDVRFVARAPYVAPSVSTESIDVRWFPVADLPTDDPDIRTLVELALTAR